MRAPRHDPARTGRRTSAILAAFLVAAAPSAAGASTPRPTGTVTIDARRPVNRVDPHSALGGDLDGHEQGETGQIYTPANVRRMRSAGLGAIAYRLRTELAVEAWHWNFHGRWSDPAKREGYWTSSARAGPRIAVSYGYRLPRRGNTLDQANDDGYSRLDDGRASTFWKSNPYLDPELAGRRAPAQWALVDLGRRRAVDALRIDWAAPYARRIRVERWTGVNALLWPERHPGHWTPLPRAAFAGRPGRQTLRLAERPVRLRFLRILLRDSSHTALPGSRDPRDHMGYAIRELGVGRLRRRTFVDLVRHAPRNTRQTVTYTSSTDPWHRASDRDPLVEEPGFDTVFRSGVTRGRPVLVPVAVLYGTPQDAAAELRWLRARRYPVRGLELGEEPDGQLASPQDYAALYVRFAGALRAADPTVPLGGPGYQTALPDWIAWPRGPHANRSWTGQFLADLRARGRISELSFFSFEWYPFDGVCRPTAPALERAPGLLTGVIRRERRDGLPARIPIVITELGYSAFAGRAEVDLPGALLDADALGTFLTLGGRTAYLYGLEPDVLIRESTRCATWGNLILFLADDAHRARQPVAAYWAARLVTGAWMGPGTGRRLIYRARSDVRGPGGLPLVTAYALRRPDGRLALMLVNKDPRRAWRIRVVVRGGGFGRPLVVEQLSRRDYRWHPRGIRGAARPDRPPTLLPLGGGGPPTVTLPPTSLSVIRPG